MKPGWDSWGTLALNLHSGRTLRRTVRSHRHGSIISLYTQVLISTSSLLRPKATAAATAAALILPCSHPDTTVDLNGSLFSLLQVCDKHGLHWKFCTFSRCCNGWILWDNSGQGTQCCSLRVWMCLKRKVCQQQTLMCWPPNRECRCSASDFPPLVGERMDVLLLDTIRRLSSSSEHRFFEDTHFNLTSNYRLVSFPPLSSLSSSQGQRVLITHVNFVLSLSFQYSWSIFSL